MIGTRFVPIRAYSPLHTTDGAAASSPDEADKDFNARRKNMAVEYLRDDHYRVVGSIETDSGGKQTARDA